MTEPAETPDAAARRLLRSRPTAALCTLLGSERWPYGSLVLTACDHDGTPILLISALAEHTRNIRAEPAVSLLFDGTVGLAEPLTGPRLTLLGRAAPDSGPRLRSRFLARHPGAALYADFKDFAFYRVEPTRAHLVAGFGRIHWLEAAELLRPMHPALVEAEASIVAHMNQDHADAIQLYASRLLGLTGGGWQMTGCDTDGCDLRRGGETARLDFTQPVHDAEEARAELVRLVRAARSQVAAG